MAPIKTAVLGGVMERSAEIDSDGKVIKSAAQDKVGKDVKIVKTLEEILEDREVELVVIGVPNNLHYEYGRRCLEAGKHVLLEKPFTVHYEDAVKLAELAKSKGLVLYTFQNRRWDADFLAVKEVLKTGKLGPLVEFVSAYDRYRPEKAVSKWKESGGQANDAIYNLGSHIIDQALQLFGKPEKLTCMSYNIRSEEGLDDSFLLHMHYPSTHPASSPYPLLVTIRASILSALSSQLRFQIKGQKGSFTKFGIDPQEAAMKAFDPNGLLIGQPGWGKEPEAEWGVLETVENDRWTQEKFETPAGSYHELYRNLHDVIRNHVEPLVKSEEAALNIQIIELALQSSKEGRTIVVP